MKTKKIKTENFYSLELGTDYGERNEEVAVLTFTPLKNKFDHFHIEISANELNGMKKWIEEFLGKR